MYIAPNSTIIICRHVPLDPTYEHTLYFASQPEQRAYFASLAKYTFNNQTYQRLNRGYLRIHTSADSLYDCNYLMFQNISYGSKWFYAFITKVEYVNNEVAEVEYEIDVMQTWWFDYRFGQCFVEREHSATDELFENIVEEGLELGDEYTIKNNDVFSMNNLGVCILVNKVNTHDISPWASSYINGVFMPVKVLAGIPANDPASIDVLLDDYQEDDIVAVYEYPLIFGDGATTTPYSGTKTISPNFAYLSGYVPKNKKLYSYPYNFLLVSNNSGQVAEYRWENWNENYRGQFAIKGVFISTVCAYLYPQHYRGVVNDYDSGITYSNFPQCAWAGDTFKAWWAQNKASFVTSGITSILASFSGGMSTGAKAVGITGDPAIGAGLALGQGLGGSFGTVAQSVAKIHDIKNTPSQTHGQTQTDSLNAGIGRVQFDFYQLCIKPQYAQIIDDYFTRFGYATKRTKTPNTHARPHWTFVKTNGCTIVGSIPSDDERKICSIMDKGITFWMHGSEVGNYSLDNSPA